MMIRSWPLVAGAICAAALVAGVLVGVEWFAFSYIAAFVEGGSQEGSSSLRLLIAAFATPVFLIGLVFPGLPVWLWLHGIGRTSYSVAALAGAIGCSIAGVMLTASSAGWYSLTSVIWLGLPGAAAGLVLRRLAYVRPKPRPAPSS